MSKIAVSQEEITQLEAKIKCPHCEAIVWVKIIEWGLESICPACDEEIIVVNS